MVLGGVVEEGPLAGRQHRARRGAARPGRGARSRRAALGDPAYGQARPHGASLAYDELVHYLLDALDELISGGTAAQLVVGEEA